MTTELLKIEDLHAWYGESHILHGVNLTVHQGEVVTQLGRNGAGRTTTGEVFWHQMPKGKSRCF